jgi:hypothetical protein
VEAVGEEGGEAGRGLRHRIRTGDADDVEALGRGLGEKEFLQKSRLA